MTFFDRRDPAAGSQTPSAVSARGEVEGDGVTTTRIGVRRFALDGGTNALRPRARLNSVHIVGTCEEYAARSHYQSVTLADLCQASGVSERRIRHAFYECYGMSPTAHFRVAALTEVRRALLEESPMRDAVSRAASDFGFWHLSRFAGQYRALFGESPSETYARARGSQSAEKRTRHRPPSENAG
jgi:AraC-like DNA-binding protein